MLLLSRLIQEISLPNHVLLKKKAMLWEANLEVLVNYYTLYVHES